MEEAEIVELRVESYGKILKAEEALDRNIGRIESIERTLDVYAATTPMTSDRPGYPAEAESATEKGTGSGVES